MQNLINAINNSDDDYLIGLSNKGILKRSYKDINETEISVTYTDNSAEVSVADEKCTIVFPLGESKCTCPSRSICRHIITSILWLKQNTETQISDNDQQNREDDVSEVQDKKELNKPFIDELSAYPLKVIQKAMKKQYYSSFMFNASKGILPEIEETSILSVKMPEENISVRLIYPVEYSTCTCHSKDLCKHKAAAILAWQIKHKIVIPDKIKISEKNTANIDISSVHSTAEYAMKFLSDILSDGLVRTSDDIAEHTESIAVMCHNFRLASCERIMREIGNRLQGYINHSPEFNTEILFSSIMENITLLNRIYKTNNEKEIYNYLGEFKNTYIISDTLEILPIAQRHFSSEAGYEGDIYYFINKDLNSENKFLSYSDIRPTFYENSKSSSRSSAAPWGLYGTVKEITKSEIRLKNPKLSDGKISSSSDTKAEVLGKAILNQPVVSERIYTDFRKMIFDIFDKKLNSNSEINRLVLVSPSKCIDSVSDEISQSHSIVIEDEYKHQLTIKAKYRSENKDFFKRLSYIGDMMKNTDTRYVIFANTYIEKGRCYLYPIAIFDNIDVPDTLSENNKEDIDNNAWHYLYFSELFHNIQKLLCDIIQCGINSFDIYEQIKDYSDESQKMGLIILSNKLNDLYEFMKFKNHTYSNDNTKIIILLSEIYNYILAGIKNTEINEAIYNLNNRENNHNEFTK